MPKSDDGQNETSAEDRRRVEMCVEWVPTNDSQAMPTHHWQAVAHVDGERVCNCRCYTREVALEEASGAVAGAGVDFLEDLEDA